MRLGAADHDAVLPLGHHVDEQVRVPLLVGLLAPVALHVGHAADGDQIVILEVDQKLFEALVVIRAVLLVDLIGDDVGRVERVHPGAALDAAAGLLVEGPQHFYTRSSVLWWIWLKRLMVWPVRWDLTGKGIS